jgi:site-specific recombinase XerD
MDILRKYDFKLPIISNQKYNSYLKVLGAFCNLKKRVTSHVARHTFATTVTLANGVRIEVISKMLGHTNIKTTQIYAKVCQPEVDNEFNRLNKIL